MRAVYGSAVALAVLVAVAAAGADDKADKVDGKKLVGRWEASGGKAVEQGIGGTLEFFKDGKLTLLMRKGELKKEATGTYKLDGRKLTLTLESGGKQKTEDVTVTELTDASLKLKDSRDLIDEFKRVKDKDKK